MALGKLLGKGEVSRGKDGVNLDGTSIASFYASLVGISDHADVPGGGVENIERPDASRVDSGGLTRGRSSKGEQEKLEKDRGTEWERLERVGSQSQASTSGRGAAVDTWNLHPGDSVSEKRSTRFGGGPSQSMKQGIRTGTSNYADFSRGQSVPELTSFGYRPAKTEGLKLDDRGLGNKLGTQKKVPSYRIRIPEGNIGYKMLKKAGWKEDKGLGVSEQGPLEPVKTQMKVDKRGIGAQKQVQTNSGVGNKKRKDAPGGGNSGGKRQLTRAELKQKAEEEKQKEHAIAMYMYRAFAPDNI